VCFEYICWKFAERLLDRVNTPLCLIVTSSFFRINKHNNITQLCLVRFNPAYRLLSYLQIIL